MNNERRNKLKNIMKTLSSIVNDIEKVKGEEEDYMDNMPENLQGSDRYSKAEEACECLESAIENIENAIEDIDTARE